MTRVVYGIHPVIELIRHKPESVIEARFVDSPNPTIVELRTLAAQKHVRISPSDKNGLARFAGTPDHQGAAASAKPYEYAEIEDMIADAKAAGEEPLLVALANVQDPHNMGSIMRSAWLLGAHGLFFPKDRAAQVTPVVCKASSGAVECMKLAAVNNLARALDVVKKEGVWVVGTDMAGGKAPAELDLKLPICLVIGGEGEGMRRLTHKMCDFMASIPSRDASFSFNASVAAALLLGEALRQRSV